MASLWMSAWLVCLFRRRGTGAETMDGIANRNHGAGILNKFSSQYVLRVLPAIDKCCRLKVKEYPGLKEITKWVEIELWNSIPKPSYIDSYITR